MGTKSVRCNLTGVQLCLFGNFSRRPVPNNLKPAIAQAVLLLQERFSIPDDRVLFHRDCSPSECPGTLITKKDFLTWVKTRAQDCPPEIQEQQRQVIAAAGFSIHTFPRWAILWLGLANSLVVVIALLWRRFRRPKRTDSLDNVKFPHFKDTTL